MNLMNAPVSVNLVVVTALLFGFAPAFITRLLTLVWPADDPRRCELRAELERIPYWKRPIWVFEQLETTLFDGLPARARAVPRAVLERRLVRVETRLDLIGAKADKYEALWQEHQELQAHGPWKDVTIRSIRRTFVVAPELATYFYGDLAEQLRHEWRSLEAERARLLVAIERDEASEEGSEPS